MNDVVVTLNRVRIALPVITDPAETVINDAAIKVVHVSEKLCSFTAYRDQNPWPLLLLSNFNKRCLIAEKAERTGSLPVHV